MLPKEQLREEVYAKFLYYTQLHLPTKKVLGALEKSGASHQEIEVVRAWFEKNNAKTKHKQGLILTIIGSALLIIGFIFTAILFHLNAPFQEVMYGFTGIGLVLLIWGIQVLFKPQPPQ